jgi:DNA-binding beta-propeller fold protein YncE
MTNVSTRLGVCAALLGTLCLRCSSGGVDQDDSARGSDGNGSFAGTASAAGGSGNTNIGGTSSSAGNGGMPVVPPETEIEASFLAPVVTGKYVFSANPQSGRVAVIDADSYAVRLFNAGFGPKYLAAIPGGKGAIVINELSHDATLFRLVGDDVSIDGEALPVHEGANAWAMSEDGRFAIAWTQTPNDAKPDPTSGSQTITVLGLDSAKSQRLTVGFRPTQVVIDEAGEHAFVVNSDGVSVVELSDAPIVSFLARVSEDPLEEADARDVSIPRDGKFALVRLDGSSQLRVVDLAREDGLSLFDMGAPVSDLDLSSDGKLALATLPGVAQVALIPVPPTGDAASFERIAIPGEVTSSVSLSGASELALLYQNAKEANNSHLTILDLRPEMNRALRTLDVKGPVSAAFAAPGAGAAIVFQRPIAGSSKAGLFSGVPTLQKRSPKIVGTDAAPSALSFDESGAFALVTVGSEKTKTQGVYRVRLDTMQEDYLQLASPPSPGATGIVEEVGRGFVAQQHPEGRITFIDLETARAHTITGFELAARILQ